MLSKQFIKLFSTSQSITPISNNQISNIGKLGLTVNKLQDTVHVKINTPPGADRVPTDICCVIDNSYSMTDQATFQNQSGKTEKSDLCILDLVKHASSTIIHNLKSQDSISLVKYSTTAKEILSLQQTNKKGQKYSLKKLNRIEPEGATNIWDGLKTGLDSLRDGRNYNSHLLILTDGQPNQHPPRGYEYTFQKYLENNKYDISNVHSFGFGNDLDHMLLKYFSDVGYGSFGYIPDSAFIGTIFINSLSNILSTYIPKANLHIKPLNGAKITDFNGNVYQNEDVMLQKVSSIQYDQSKDFVYKIDLLNHQEGTPYIEVKLQYTDENDELQILTQTSGEKDITSTSDWEDIQSNILRTQLAITTDNLWKNLDEPLRNQLYEQNLTAFNNNPFFRQIKNSTGSKSKFTNFVGDLYIDYTGQVKEAIQKDEWYQRWGMYYLASLSSAHSLQQANNFKDPGVQHYGSSLFKSLQDEIEQVFMDMEPPKPTQSYQNVSFNVKTMRSYYNSSNPCFAKGCQVLMADGSSKNVEDIVKGDLIKGQKDGEIQKIECVIKTECTSGYTQLVTLENNLKITPYHPVLNEKTGEWEFPINLQEPQIEKCKAVYSFLLEDRLEGKSNSINVNGQNAATFAHHLQNNEVIEHHYFGTEKIVEDLKQMRGWELGLVVLQQGCLRKSQKTGLVDQIIQQQQQEQYSQQNLV